MEINLSILKFLILKRYQILTKNYPTVKVDECWPFKIVDQILKYGKKINYLTFYNL